MKLLICPCGWILSIERRKSGKIASSEPQREGQLQHCCMLHARLIKLRSSILHPFYLASFSWNSAFLLSNCKMPHAKCEICKYRNRISIRASHAQNLFSTSGFLSCVWHSTDQTTVTDFTSLKELPRDRISNMWISVLDTQSEVCHNIRQLLPSLTWAFSVFCGQQRPRK